MLPKNNFPRFNIPNKLKPLIGEFAWHSLTLDPTIELVSQQHYESIINTLKKYKARTPLSELKILEVASYAHITGYMLAKQNSDVTLFDISASTLQLGKKIAREKGMMADLKLVAGDFHNLPFDNDKFDLVFVASSLHHTWKWQKVLEEMFRVLKHGGLLIMENEPCKREACFYKFRTNRMNRLTAFEKKLYDLGILTTFAEPYIGSRPESLFGMIENQEIPIGSLLELTRKYAIIKELELGLGTCINELEKQLIAKKTLPKEKLEKFISDIIKKCKEKAEPYLTEKNIGIGFGLPSDQEIISFSKKISTLIKDIPADPEMEKEHLANIFGAPMKMILEKKKNYEPFSVRKKETQEIIGPNDICYAFEPYLNKILIENSSLAPSIQKSSEQDLVNFFPNKYWKYCAQESNIINMLLEKEDGIIKIIKTEGDILVIMRLFAAESKFGEYSVEIKQGSNILFVFEVWQDDSFIFTNIIKGDGGDLTISKKDINNNKISQNNLISISFIAIFKV